MRKAIDAAARDAELIAEAEKMNSNGLPPPSTWRG